MDRSAFRNASGREPANDDADMAPGFALESHVFFWFTQVVALRDRQLARLLRAHDLRVPEWRVLASLRARGRLSMGELADLSSIDRTTLSRTVDRMTRNRLLARKADKGDLRVVRLALTPAGRALFARLTPLAARTNDAALAGLDPRARAALIETLRHMRRNLAADADTKTET